MGTCHAEGCFGVPGLSRRPFVSRSWRNKRVSVRVPAVYLRLSPGGMTFGRNVRESQMESVRGRDSLHPGCKTERRGASDACPSVTPTASWWRRLIRFSPAPCQFPIRLSPGPLDSSRAVMGNTHASEHQHIMKVGEVAGVRPP